MWSPFNLRILDLKPITFYIYIYDTYPLYRNRKRMKKIDHDTCPLCCLETEDTEHFVLRCPNLEHTRNKYMNRIKIILQGIPLITGILDSREAMKIKPKLQVKDLEQISRDYLYSIHLKRTELLAIKANHM